MIRLAVVLLSSILFVSCTSTPQTNSPPERVGYTETGVASFYAMRYQNRRTASGERLNQSSDTAAHKQLPFGTRVRVTNIANSESVIVTVNDRGPFVEGRIIDLTRSAFAAIADLEQGIIDVEIEVIP